MNETDYIRQQLAAERAHLREILQAVRARSPAAKNSRPVTAYLEWAGQRLVQQLAAHSAGLEALGSTVTVAQLSRVSPTGLQPERLLALLDAWTVPLDALAAKSLRISHWRQVAHLSADSILEERQRYAAAHLALGLS